MFSRKSEPDANPEPDAKPDRPWSKSPTPEQTADTIAAALAVDLTGKYRYLWHMKHWYRNGMGGHHKSPYAAIWQSMVAAPDVAPSETLATLIDERLRLALADWRST